jgi:hypothetical protein
MRSKLIAIVFFMTIIGWSCGHQSDFQDAAKGKNTIMQQLDGTLSLNMDKAACYSDAVNPSSNTAEWNVVVSKPGHYKVWLSSATIDTTNLKYSNPVKISFMDNLLEAAPVCDKIFRNSEEVSLPYFRADSYMGSFYISEPGRYDIQVISEKVQPKEAAKKITNMATDTRLLSVILTPMTR